MAASSFSSAAGSRPGAAGAEVRYGVGSTPQPRGGIGILASQGGFEAHRRTFDAFGVDAHEVRSAAEIEAAAAVVLPGGESTTVMKAIERDALEPALRELVATGRPVFATCAGAIVLDRAHLGLLDIECRRNAYGRQIASFEADTRIEGLGEEPFRCVFIRAPRIVAVGPAVDVLASHDGSPILVRQGNLLAATFHPELAGDERLHAMFTAMIGPTA